MANPKSFIMAVTNLRFKESVEYHPGYRTVAQFETVRKIVESEEFDFCCGHDYFVPAERNTTYQGPFIFLWYDKKGTLHGTRIGKKGKILREICA